jgi:6,7-dimethyl-8-ribityllumazine synthase
MTKSLGNWSVKEKDIEPHPHSFGIITYDTQEQAINRAGLKACSRDSEAAMADIRMVGSGTSSMLIVGQRPR